MRFTLLAFFLLALGSWALIRSESASATSNVRGQRIQTSVESMWRDVTDDVKARSPFNKSNPASVLSKLAGKQRVLRLNKKTLVRILRNAPREFTPAAKNSSVVLALPLPNRTFGRFQIIEVNIMSPELAAQYPEMKTYRGIGLDDKTASLSLEITSTGLHAMITSARGTSLIEPISQSDSFNYVAYNKHDYRSDNSGKFECHVDDASGARKIAMDDVTPLRVEPPASFPTQLRTYRTVVTVTSGYTAANGGTRDSAQAAIVTTINRINQVYERELGLRLVLKQTIIYVTLAEDPFKDANGKPLDDNLSGDKNQEITDQIVGENEYDIGHIMGTHQNLGGSAVLAGVCGNGRKANAATLAPTPTTADAFVIDYVAHEFGHQLGANHTWNLLDAGSCESKSYAAATAYEPGSGVTIMGYAGICAPANLQLKSEEHFHIASIAQIMKVTQGEGSCAVLIGETNSLPVLAAGSTPRREWTIPARTPFQLTAPSFTDADSGDAARLTYLWEQTDLGAATSAAEIPIDNGSRPIFRDYSVSTNPTRVFPALKYILNNNNEPPATYPCGTEAEPQTCLTGETLATTSRTLDFNLTVRDNHPGIGGIGFFDVRLTVANTGTPFAVTAPNTADVIWQSGASQTVTWDVANTSVAPINTQTVDIKLSLDGGETFPISLASNVPNTGQSTFGVPTLTVRNTTARVRVEARDNIYFDISNANFTIEPSSSFTLTPSADTYVQGAAAARDTNYGGAMEMQVKRTLNLNTGRGRRGFVKFDTSSIVGAVASARLRVFARLTDANLPPTTMMIQKVTDTTWDEMTMTWNNQPAVESPSPLAQITVAGATGQYYEFDLTSFVQAERAAGRSVMAFRLINQQPTGNSGAFYTTVTSREAGVNRPELVIIR
jgi:hypothetical protein